MKKKKGSVWCWWCCHPFDHSPFHMPSQLKKVNGQNHFQTYGYFCSFSCMKAYNNNENDSQKNNRFTLISMMVKETYKKDIIVVTAPPRQSLQVFGGDLSIEEFRNKSQSNLKLIIHHAPVVPIQHVITEKKSTINWIQSNTNTNTDNTITEHIVNNPIKLKEKPKKLNTLEQFLEITSPHLVEEK